MKEVNYEEFIKLPSGTIYTTFGCLCVKKDSINDNQDFFYEQLTPIKSINENFDIGLSRWGEFDYTETFIIYDKEDTLQLIEKLNEN